jgi:hypothetical protein
VNYRDLNVLQKRRLFRFGALAVVLVAGVLFHQKVGGYAVIRIVYFVVILLVFFTRTRRRTPGRTGGGWRRLWPAGLRGSGGRDVAAIPDPPPNIHGAPGWVRDSDDPMIERYWDGTNWVRTRRWNGKEWIEGR